MKALITCIVLFCSITAIAQEKSRPQTPTEPSPYLSEPFNLKMKKQRLCFIYILLPIVSSIHIKLSS